MTASAVGHYGPELMEAINQRRLPKFATGGLVGSLPSFTDNLNLPDPEQLSRPATPAALTPINIHLPGISDPVTMHGSEDAVSQLTAAARMLNLKQG
ncbi:hypothetical protein [Paludibacterium denitrificans]|uniref:Uncharacterized protein n=1 Tax=Paludibacterium denitrificans TaxID=2675226 RepID=A0A844GEL8_9NEIS|nr:hypothetical protein [Paludibacterium denitrificans]MTD34099.1 hypothetical protein [Paludibacterium denitrificans]